MRKPKDGGQPCPHPDGAHDRLINRGNMSAISTSLTQRGKRRICRCRKGERPFSATRDTVFFDLRSPAAKVLMARTMLLVKVALADIGFVLGVTAATVLAWRRRAAQHAHAINGHRLRALPVTQGQRDAMWSFIRRQHAQQAGPDGASTAWSEDGRQWVWLSGAPEFRLILAACVGPRTVASALRLMERTAAVVLGVPCCVSDGFSGDLSALIDVSSTLKTFPRTGKPGHPKQALKEPHPDVVYGQVINKKRKGRLQELISRVCCGSKRLEWCHRTPGMAAGLTDHVWSFRELLTAKFEPIHNQSGSG